jgi:hypothetical protein
VRWLTAALVSIACGWGLLHWAERRPVAHPPPGAVAFAEPEQTAPGRQPFSIGKYRITPLAHFNIRARVMSREDYSFDHESELSPLDLAVAWGRMSDPAIYQQLAISQGNRFYYWHYDDKPPIPNDEIISSSSNMHLIPADATVKRQMERVRPGEIVHFEGELIEATEPSGWHWRSSLSRTDTGAGACELVWVQAFQIES